MELTAPQQRRRKHLEQEIRHSAQKMGENLRAIHDEGLYGSTHPTWEAYCLDVWGMSKRHADRIVGHWKVLNLISPIEDEMGPMGPKNTPSYQPNTPSYQPSEILKERHTREVEGLPDEEKAAVLNEAIATAPKENGKPKLTANHVRETREKRQEKPPKPGKAKPSHQTLVDDLLKKHVGPLARGIDDVANALGGKGTNHAAALDGLGAAEKSLKAMRGGKR